MQDTAVIELLTAIRDAASPGDLDQAAMLRRLVTIQVQIDGILSADRAHARRPDLPSIVPGVMAAAAAILRNLAGRGEGK